MSDVIIDSVMGHMKSLLQELTDQAATAHDQWLTMAREIQAENSGMGRMWEPTDEEERRAKDKQRKCDEFYDRAKIIGECREVVARHVAAIIGENIEIQFSKWNMAGK